MLGGVADPCRETEAWRGKGEGERGPRRRGRAAGRSSGAARWQAGSAVAAPCGGDGVRAALRRPCGKAARGEWELWCVVRDGAPQSTARCAGPRRCSRVRGVRRAFRAGSCGCFLRGERNPFPPPHKWGFSVSPAALHQVLGLSSLSSAQTSQLLVQQQQMGAWTAAGLVSLLGLAPACSLGQIRAHRSFLTSSPAGLGWGSSWCGVRRVVPGGRGCAG